MSPGVPGGVGSAVITMNGSGQMTIDPRIPTMPGRSTSDFHGPGRHRWHQARSTVRCSASRTKVGLHLTRRTACEADGLVHGMAASN